MANSSTSHNPNSSANSKAQVGTTQSTHPSTDKSPMHRALHQSPSTFVFSQFTSRFPPYPAKINPSTVLNLVDISYPESYLRTPMPWAPLFDWQWYINPSSGNAYKGASRILEYDADIGYADDTEETKQSVEVEEGSTMQGWGDGGREWDGFERINLKRRFSDSRSESNTQHKKMRSNS